ncbi:MAG: hypothetical protein ACPIOQ_71775, partial [Promethearchaeia archaeon]
MGDGRSRREHFPVARLPVESAGVHALARGLGLAPYSTTHVSQSRTTGTSVADDNGAGAGAG